MKKLLLAILLSLTALAHAEPNGGCNFTSGSPYCGAFTGHTLTIGTQGPQDLNIKTNDITRISIDGSTGVVSGIVLQLANSVYLQGLETDGDAQNLIGIDSSNDTRIIAGGSSGDQIQFALGGGGGTGQWFISTSTLSPQTTAAENIGSLAVAVSNVFARNVQADTGSNLTLSARNGSVDFYSIASDATPLKRWRVDATTGGLLQDATNGGPLRMSISASAINKGIELGTNAATSDVGTHQLFINDTTNQDDVAILRSTADTAGSRINLLKSRATDGTADTIVGASDVLGQIVFKAADGATFQNAAMIRAVMDGTPGTTDVPGKLEFSTTSDGSATVLTRWQINSAGILQSDGTNGGGLTLAQTGANLTPIISGHTSIDSDVSAISSTHMGLLINQSATIGDSTAFVANGADANGVQIAFFKTRATAPAMDANTIVVSGDTVGRLNFRGADGAAYISSAAIIAAIDGTPGANDMPGRLVFQTTPDGSTTLTTALTISSAQAATFTQQITSSRTTDLGWSVIASGAGVACNTACTSACVAGQNATFGLVSCATAVTGLCICAGAS